MMVKTRSVKRLFSVYLFVLLSIMFSDVFAQNRLERLDINIALSNGVIATEETIVSLEIFSRNEAGMILFNTFSALTILPGENSVSLAQLYVPPEDNINGSYDVFFQCFPDCAGLATFQLFLQDDGSSGFEFNSVEASLFPPSLDLEIIEFELVEISISETLNSENQSFEVNVSNEEIFWLEIEHDGGDLNCTTLNIDSRVELALYDVEGNLLAEDDGFRGTRMLPIIDEVDLRPGIYFLAVAGANALFRPLFNTRQNIIEAGILNVDCLLGDTPVVPPTAPTPPAIPTPPNRQSTNLPAIFLLLSE